MAYKASSDGEKRARYLLPLMWLSVATSGIGLVSAAWVWYFRRRRRLCMVPRPTIEKAADLVGPSEVEDFLALYDVSPTRGFIPREDPVERLAHLELQPHEDVVRRLPALLESGLARGELRSLPLVPDLPKLLRTEGERRRGLLVFSALAQAYIWGGGPDVTPIDRLPACLAVPLHRLARAMGTAPILSHMSTCLSNWARIDKSEPFLVVPNLRTILSFTGDANEAFFNLITLQIEATGGPAIASLEKARRISCRVLSGDVPSELQAAALDCVAVCLVEVCGRVEAMTEALVSMPSGLDPTFFYHRFRPYLSGWKGNPTLPHGVVFEGVGWGRRQRYSGGSAAQSSLVGALDLYLGIDHSSGGGRASSSSSVAFLRDMRSYMPRQHARFLHHLEVWSRCHAHLSLRSLIRTLAPHHAARRAYDACLSALAEFRTKHLGIVSLYILSQQRRKGGAAAEGEAGGLEGAAGGKGTGGQDLLTFLRPLRDGTLQRREVERQ